MKLASILMCSGIERWQASYSVGEFDLIDSYTEAGVAHADLLSSYM
jgi:hypothetical protein